MAQGALALPLANGSANGSTLSEQELREVLEYEKILKLRDEILAGKHPRLKIPAHAVGKFVARPAHSPSIPVTRPTPTEATVSYPANAPSSLLQRDHTPAVHQPSPHLQKSPTVARYATTKSGSSGIDPIFLTKSDDLVKAEIQLQRQRIERALKEQVDQKRVQSRGKNNEHDAVDPDYDLGRILDRAHEIVKPVSDAPVNKAKGTSTPSDSFDENSYYSSKVDDSPVEHEVATQLSSVEQLSDRPTETRDTGSSTYHAEAKDDRVGLTQNGMHPSGSGGKEAHIDQLERQPYATLQNESAHKMNGTYYYNQEPPDVIEEPEYSPPAANALGALRQNTESVTQLTEAQGQRHNGQALVPAESRPAISSQKRARSASPPSPEVRIVRNHISSPVAPQPARVSPLAVIKLAPISQERPEVEELHSTSGSGPRKRGRRTPTYGPRKPRNNRKKRREKEENSRKYSLRSEMEDTDTDIVIAGSGGVHERRVAGSPEPYIKAEPESPPPFMSVSKALPHRRQEQQQEYGPIEIDSTSPRDLRSGSYYVRRPEHPSVVYGYDPDTPHSVLTMRAPSQVSLERPQREDQDLRRIANARPVRAASHAYVERPMAEQPQYYRDPRGSYATRYIRSERSRSPQPSRDALRERYSPINQAPTIMAPPPRPIIVDQHGNKYYAAPPETDMKQSVAPSSMGPGPEYHYERAPTRDRVIRESIPISDSYDDGHYAQRVAPPPFAPRRVLQQPEVEGADHRVYRQREYSMRPLEAGMAREEVVHVREYPERRRLSHVEDLTMPQEYGSRTHSVRPHSSRQETPREYVPRVHSVRPEREYVTTVPSRAEVAPPSLREFSVRADGTRRTEDYFAGDAERISYAPQPQGRRYVDDNDLIELPREMAPGGFAEDTRRASYRY
ncbi:MAG: hypothetical protein M1827_001794 [Pycnora praestabilis]|nr:MAG: hypothetical protein M1827_001794 [Pycnora praestabilis]